MKLAHEGLSLWYGTPDAPGPGDDDVVARSGVSLVVAAQPANVNNVVVVPYRVDGGVVRTASGSLFRTDFSRSVQYFRVSFPPLPTGELVEYSPVLSCAGRQVPPPSGTARFPSKFRLEPSQARSAAPQALGQASEVERFDAGLDFVATVSVQFKPFQFIGETAEGVRVNFIVGNGAVEGPGCRAKLLDASADHMIVRRDGMGVVRIRAAFQTDEGAILDVASGGYVDFGPHGFRRAVDHRLPDRSPIVLSPLLWTRHPKYAWLSRIQMIGVGYTHLDAHQVIYELYAVSARNAGSVSTSA